MFSRRQFLTTGSAALAGLPFLNIACMSEQLASYADTIGLQLWTVRDLLAEDAKATLSALKSVGYQQVEMMDTNQLQALKPLCDDLGLAVNSSFISWSAVTGRWDLRPDMSPITLDEIIERGKKAGLSHLVFGYMFPQERSTIDDYKKIADQLNAAGEKVQSAGMQLCYHNHSFEFKPTEGQVPFEVLIERFDKKLVQFELDVFWSKIGGLDSVALFKRIAERTRLLHLKDKKASVPTIYDETKVPVDAFQPLGRGEVDLKTIIELAAQAGVDYCFVEQDQSPDPLADVAVSRQWVMQSVEQ